MKANLENTNDVREYLNFLKKVRQQVENWPQHMKEDGYATRQWRLGSRNDSVSIDNRTDKHILNKPQQDLMPSV